MAFAQQGNLIAYYPLNSTPNDTTGHFGPMLLTNTPFIGGGIYCNGNYQFGDTNWCRAETPILPASIFHTFSVSAKFKVDSIRQFERPVIIGGAGWRWIACILKSDSTVALLYNNQNRQPSTLHYSTNTWHEMTITYDSSNTIAKLYLDGVLACSTLFTIQHGPEYDRTFGVTNFSNATVFKGFLKDLKIYSTVIVPTSVIDIESLLPANIQLSQNYPNPFNPSTTIRFRLTYSGFVDLSVHNILGQKIATLVSEYLVAGEHTIQWSATEFASGVYFYRLQAGRLSETKKLLLSK
ncbi:MAG: LamG-like jellyroll fold domain-containing protein [Bacteroidota bacterium]|nr:LamG-like jellyroll fold domain-containing protein [Bacteroidota bacterium]